MSRASSVPAHSLLRGAVIDTAPPRGNDRDGRRGRGRWRRAGVWVVAAAFGFTGCASDAESETVALPAASGSAVSIVDAEPADGPGIDLGSASEALIRGQRPGGGDSDGSDDSAPSSETEPTDTEPSDDTFDTAPVEPAEDTEPSDDESFEDTDPSDTEPAGQTPSGAASGDGRLEDDSPTCLVVADLIRQRDQFNGLFSDLGEQLDGAASLDEATVIFESLVGDVVGEGRVILAGVEDNYLALAQQQPALESSLAAHLELLGALLDAYESFSGADLADVQAAIAREVGTDLQERGVAGRDEIDAFTRDACGVAFRTS